MIDSSSHDQLKQAIKECIQNDSDILDKLRKEIRPLKNTMRRIQPRATTSISLVATDGGNNQLQFDPFLVQLIRVVDSSNNEYCLEAVSPTNSILLLSKRQFDEQGEPVTALGKMMKFLGVTTLPELSHMIRPPKAQDQPISPSWVQVYRELVEWAVLFSLLEKDFGTDTLIICDGLLRTKVFAKDLFSRLLQGIKERIEVHEKKKRNIYLVGVAKHSKVLSRYRLAMALEGVLQTDYAAYVEVPRDVEAKAYVWNEFARGNDIVEEGQEINKFVGGKMFLVKFGNRRNDPVWPVDIFLEQSSKAQIILGSMLADAMNGFPVPFYPMCLQRAHENAALVDFDFDILQEHIYNGIRQQLGVQSSTLDSFMLQDTDPSQQRYS